jgi:uncharacterized RDD family membrane protein YckC
MFCSVCGGEVQTTDRFCPKCGQTVSFAAPAAYAAQPGVAAPPMAAHRYAGFWLRFVAYLIDSLIVGVPTGIIIVIFIAMMGGITAFHFRLPDNPNPDPAQVMALLASMLGFFTIIGVCSLAISWLYFASMESSERQATLGKSVLALRVTDKNGMRLTFGHATGRYFSKIITGLVPLAIGWILAGLTEKKQALHDFIAGTLVWRDS